MSAPAMTACELLEELGREQARRRFIQQPLHSMSWTTSFKRDEPTTYVVNVWVKDDDVGYQKGAHVEYDGTDEGRAAAEAQAIDLAMAYVAKREVGS